MAPPLRKGNATFSDIARLHDERAVEIVHGEIVDKASPTPRHGDAQAALTETVRRYFARKPGGRWPGGWWIVTEVEVEYEAHEVYRHDVVGWRRERSPERPSEWPVHLRPDWVCEVLSTHRRRDLVDKFRVLQAAGVPHYWIVDPEEKTLIVHRHTPKGYMVALAAATGETVRAEPFDGIELRVGVLFGDEEPDEYRRSPRRDVP